MKRRTIKIKKDVYDEVSQICKDKDTSIGMFIEQKANEYLQTIKPSPIQGNWSGHESWILFASYMGEQDIEKDELIQIVTGRRGGTCKGGICFIFNDEGMSNEASAKASRRRLLENVENIKVEVYRYRLDYGMERY